MTPVQLVVAIVVGAMLIGGLVVGIVRILED